MEATGEGLSSNVNAPLATICRYRSDLGGRVVNAIVLRHGVQIQVVADFALDARLAFGCLTSRRVELGAFGFVEPERCHNSVAVLKSNSTGRSGSQGRGS